MSEAFPHLILNNFKTKLVPLGRMNFDLQQAVTRCPSPVFLQGERIATILKHCFPVPKPDSKRVLTFSNDSDYISFRHHTYTKAAGSTSVELKEVRRCRILACFVIPHRCLLCCVQVGPRFELRPYRIMLGALDQPDADDEWVMRPYMNTARKKDVL
jgi:U3 small nucleolar ribonucleoprotein protein IMP4